MGNPDKSALIRKKVSEFAKRKIGFKVGTGECTDLAAIPLKEANAKSAADFGKMTPNGNYVWGKEIRVQNVMPGDILQFRNHKIKTTINTVETTSSKYGGSTIKTTESEEELIRPHHTAVVANSSGKGKGVLEICEQNVAPRGSSTVLRKVQENTLYIKNQKITKKSKPSTIMGVKTEISVTTVIKVSGRIWAYKPVSKK